MDTVYKSAEILIFGPLIVAVTLAAVVFFRMHYGKYKNYNGDF